MSIMTGAHYGPGNEEELSPICVRRWERATSVMGCVAIDTHFLHFKITNTF